MIRFKDKRGEYEFSDVRDLKTFLASDGVENFDMHQFGYLVSNLTGHIKLSAYCTKGLEALLDLRRRGMTAVVEELSK